MQEIASSGAPSLAPQTGELGHNGGPPHDDKLDLIWGIDEIGKLIGRNYTQTYHMVRSGHLPMVRQIGERYVASRRKLIAFFLEDAA